MYFRVAIIMICRFFINQTEEIMEERLTKIAETSFRKAMAEFSYWGDIGIALKNIQSEIREVSQRTRTVEQCFLERRT